VTVDVYVCILLVATVTSRMHAHIHKFIPSLAAY